MHVRAQERESADAARARQLVRSVRVGHGAGPAPFSGATGGVGFDAFVQPGHWHHLDWTGGGAGEAAMQALCWLVVPVLLIMC